MSYCRLSSECDAYVYGTMDGRWVIWCGEGRFEDHSPGECADRLKQLKEMGYRIPQDAIDELMEESEEVQ